MAASTSTAAHSNNNSCYDVFISHRGPDVKKTFASHLYHRLISYGLRVFLDYKELQEGEEFPCQIKDAIKTASVQIAIFSPRYADSQWCLDELVLMLETRAHIIPVFHHVKPTELRRTQGEGVYATSLRNLQKKRKYDADQPRYDSKTIENWRNALSQVADISGFDLDEGFNGDEGELLDRLVKVVLEKGIKKLVVVKKGIKELDVARYPTGLKEVVEDFEKKLSLQGFVGITGLGGVGKTTLAKELFNEKSSGYSQSCFLSDVREKAKTSIPSLQRKLLKHLGASKEDLDAFEEAVDSKDEGLEILRKHFKKLSAPVLLVLDDIDHHEQVHALLPVADKGIFPLPPSSLILITARDKNVLIRSGVQEPSIYKLKGLNTERSRELFCSHAFSQPHPMQGFEDLVDQFLKACDGLPLSLKVFGGLLYGNTNKSYWKNELEELRKALPHDIQKSLQISYDALQPDEKQMFLVIACFFIGKSRDTAITVWKASGWNGSRGFEILLSKCLVELDIIVENPIDMYRIRMHDHLRDMGRYLANNTLGFPRRLWRGTKHRKDLLQQSFEATKVRGIRMLRSEHYCDERADSDKESADSDDDNELASYNMKNLQLLDIDMEEDHLKCLLDGMDSPNLLWFRWRNCPCSSLPPYIPMEKLRVLEVEGGKLETLWQEDSQTPFRLRELRIVVTFLHKIPKSIGQLKHLELMVVHIRVVHIREDYTVEIPKEFCDLPSLKHLVLEISKLRSLPDSFGNLSKLEHINLANCYSLKRLPDSFGNLSSLQRIDLSGCNALQNLPDSFGNLSKLEHINLEECCDLERLPDSFGGLSSLQYINLSCGGDLEYDDLQYSALKRLPDSFGNLSKLEHINLQGCCALERLPDSFRNLIKLKYINLLGCHKLTIPGGTFRKITLEYMRFPEWRIEVLPPQIAHQWSLEKLLLWLINMGEWPSATGESSHLEKLVLETPFLEALPPSFGRDLRNLKHLELRSCRSLKRLPDSFLLMDQLTKLIVEDCPLQELHVEAVEGGSETMTHSGGQGTLSNLERVLLRLQHLELHKTQISEISFPTGVCNNLQYLDIRDCQDLVEVGTLPNALIKLQLIDCPKLRKIERLSGFAKLQTLGVSRCKEVEELPSIKNKSAALAESTGPRELNNSDFSFDNCLLHLQHLELHNTAISEVLYPTGVCPNLQYLDIKDCRYLVEVGTLPNALIKLQLTGCPESRKIALDVRRRKEVAELRELDVSGCSRLEEMPGVGYLQSLVWLRASECVKLQSIQGLEQMAQLRELEVSYCFELKELLGVEHLKSLLKLQARSCRKLKNIQGLAQLTQLRELDVSFCSELEDLPEVEHLRSLEKLWACGCKKLKSIRGSAQLTQLRELDVSECSELEELLDIEHLRSLDKLRACNCARLKHLQGLAQLSQLRELDVSGCSRLEEMPGVGYLQSLVCLRASECVKLQSIQGLEQMAQLLELHVCNCFELEELPGIEHLKSLKELLATNCKKLKSIQGLEQVTQLKYLDVSGCYELEKMPDVGCLESLVVLRASGCVKLNSIQGLEQMTQLRELDVSCCLELEELPGFERLTSLMKLRARCCTKLKRIKGLAQLAQLRELDVSLCPELEEH